MANQCPRPNLHRRDLARPGPVGSDGSDAVVPAPGARAPVRRAALRKAFAASVGRGVAGIGAYPGRRPGVPFAGPTTGNRASVNPRTAVRESGPAIHATSSHVTVDGQPA
jgi:hypothetical protein